MALAGSTGSGKRMQNHAPYGCMAYLVKNSGIYGDFLTGYCAASPARRRV
ncbi:acetyl xylan esterase [Salmonella enterica subsp. enterica]|nr:acetyl xylan esterase [Salmonella enterica subsp. enterica serovar Tornow]